MKSLMLLFILVLPAALFSQTDFSSDSATAVLRHLAVDIGPRPMGSPAEQEALRFAVLKFREYGCDTAYVMPMLQTTRVNTTSGIAVGVKRGATKRIILLGGHIDSAGPEIPGADDDGSGAATVIELARVLAKRSLQSTLVFCCFGGEEAGLEGSKYFVDHYADLDSVALMLQIDMANGIGLIELDPDTHGANAPRWLTSATIEEFHTLGYTGLRYPTHFFSINYAGSAGSGSDHESFLEKGVPAVDLSTDVGKPIHTPRDNFDNFDPRGLKRSGDVFLRLVERFDHGTPSRSLDRYWLYLIGTTPIYVPMWGIGVFVACALLSALAAFFGVRRRREDPNNPERIRWSGIKIFLLALCMTAAGWFTPDFLGLVRGLRHPWFTSIDLYGIVSGLVMLLTLLFLLRITKVRLSSCPYVYFKRAAIILAVFIALLSWFSPKLAVEPAAALLLVSLAIIVRQPALRLFLLVVSPMWMIRLVFSEWRELLFRSIASASALGSTPASSTTHLFVIIVGSVCMLPFLYAAAGVVADSAPLRRISVASQSVWAPALLLLLTGGLGAYALALPVYNQLWYKPVRITEQYDMRTAEKKITLQSPEYFSGMALHWGDSDTLLNGRTNNAVLKAHSAFDTSWLRVGRDDQRVAVNDSVVEHRVTLSLRASMRPLDVTVTYSHRGKTPQISSSRWIYRKDGEAWKFEWSAFPDTSLTVPVTFQLAAGDSLQETIEATFSRLAEPVRSEQELTYFTPRTRYVTSYSYKGK
jgi:hypothetical protein